MLQMRMCSNQMKQTKVLARFLPLPAVSASFSYRNVNFPPQLYGIRYKSYKMEQPVFWPTHSRGKQLICLIILVLYILKADEICTVDK